MQHQENIKIVLRTHFLLQFFITPLAILPKYRIVSFKSLLFFINSHKVIRVFPATQAHLNVLITLQDQFNNEAVSIT